MSTQQYSLDYAEEERADDTREQDDYYSIDHNYDFDSSYEFDNGPREEEDQHEEQQDFYNSHNDHYYEEEQSGYFDALPFEPEDDYYSQQEEYDHLQKEDDYYQEVEFQEQQESIREEISDEYYEEESYWADLEEEEQHYYENEELEHDFEIQALEEMERENQLQQEAFFASEQERINHQQQQFAEYEYQLQQEHDQQNLLRNEKQRRTGRVRGYNHFADQVTYRLRDHLPNFVEYRHDLDSVKQHKKGLKTANGESRVLEDIRSSIMQQDEIDKFPSPYFRLLPRWNQNRRSIVYDKVSEIIWYPFHIALEIAERVISKIATFGFRIVAFPLRSIFSKYQNFALQVSEKGKYKHLKENVIKLYHQGFSKSKMIELLSVTHEAVTEILDNMYIEISQNSPVLINNSPDNTKETMKLMNEEKEKQEKTEQKKEKEQNNSKTQLEDPPAPKDHAEDEMDEQNTIDLIIALHNQNIPLYQIADLLNLEINFLFYLVKKLRKHHLNKVKNKKELENAIPSVKSILKQYSHIINDDVINQLPENTILSMDYLRSKTKLGDQKIRFTYLTELMLQINLLLLEGYTPQQVADLVGYAKDNIIRIRKRYQFPNKNFGKYKLVYPIDNKQLAQQLGITEKRIYDIFKFELLTEMNKRLVAGQDVKAIAKDIGLYYRTALDWKDTYKLPNTVSYPGFTKPEVLFDNSWAQVEPSKLEYDKGTHSRYLYLSPETQITNKRCEFVQLKELEGLTPTELKEQGPFTMMDKKHELVLSDIYSIESIQVNEAYYIETAKEIGTLVGSSTTLSTDDRNGLIQTKMENYSNQSVLAARSFGKLASYLPTFFNLFEGKKEPLRIVMKSKTIEEIKNRLIFEFKSIIEGCKKLNINYKNFLEFRYLSHQNLMDLYNRYGYPNLISDTFMENIEKIGIKGKKANINNPILTVDLLYVMGLMGSDGYLLDQISKRKSVSGFNNTIKELIDFHIKFLDSIFPQRHVALRNPRPPKNVTFEAVTYNYAFSRIINNFSVKGIDVEDRKAFLRILRLPPNFISAFIEGFVDGDGNVEFGSQKISIGIFNPYRANNFVLLLKKLGIHATIVFSKQRTKPPGSDKYMISNKWDVRVEGNEDLIRFMDLIQLKHPKKKKEIIKLRKRLEKQNSLSSKYKLAPIRCGYLLKQIRNELNITQKELDNAVGMVNLTWQLENGKSRTSVKNISKMIVYFEKKGATDRIKEFKQLKLLISNDYLLIKPKIKKIQGLFKLVKIKIRNRLITDNSLILDGSEI